MVLLNFDTLCNVAEYVEPHPVVYFNLMAVNKMFYAVFSSDRAWQYLNPYNCASDIMQSFTSTTSASDREMIRINLPLHDERRESSLSRVYLYRDHRACQIGYKVIGRLELGRGRHYRNHFEFEEQFNLFVLLDILVCSLPKWPLHKVYNRQVLKCAVHINPFAIAHKELDGERDRELCLKAATLNSGAIKYMKGLFNNDKEFFLETIRREGANFDRMVVPYSLYGDEDIAVCQLRHGIMPLYDISEIFPREDANRIQRVALSLYPGALEFCSEQIQDDIGMVRFAVDAHPSCIRYASERLRDDKEIVLMALKRDGSSYQYVSRRLQEDVDVITTVSREQKGKSGIEAARHRNACDCCGNNYFSEFLRVAWKDPPVIVEKVGSTCNCSVVKQENVVKHILVNGAGAVRMLLESRTCDLNISVLDIGDVFCTKGYGGLIMKRYAQGKSIAIPSEVTERMERLGCQPYLYDNEIPSYKAWKTRLERSVADRLEDECDFVSKLVRGNLYALECEAKITDGEDDTAVVIVEAGVFSRTKESEFCLVILAIKLLEPTSHVRKRLRRSRRLRNSKS